MAFDVTLPDLGDGIESGDVLEIYVTVGQSVTKEQGLIELETDKATVTVPSPKAGKISKILVTPGQSVPVGSAIVQLELEEAGTPTPAEQPPTPRPTKDSSSSPKASPSSPAASVDGPASQETSPQSAPAIKPVAVPARSTDRKSTRLNSSH